MCSRSDAAPVGRRAVLGGALAVVWLVASAHTPYRQWLIYRQRHLLILGTKSEPGGYRLCRAVAETLAAHLPDSRAQPSRAASLARLASLLATGQMDVAVLARAEAAALRAGAGPFAGVGPVDLRALFGLGPYLLVARADFAEAHAYLVVETLDRNRAALGPAARLPRAEADALPLHPGARAYLDDGGSAPPDSGG